MTNEVSKDISVEDLDLKKGVITAVLSSVSDAGGVMLPTLIKERMLAFQLNKECLPMYGSFQTALVEVPRYLEVEDPGPTVLCIDTNEMDISPNTQSIYHALDNNFHKLSLQKSSNGSITNAAATAIKNTVGILSEVSDVSREWADPSIRITVKRGSDGCYYTRIDGYVRVGSYVVRVQTNYTAGFWTNENIHIAEVEFLHVVSNTATNIGKTLIYSDTHCGLLGNEIFVASAIKASSGILQIPEWFGSMVGKATSEIDASLRTGSYSDGEMAEQINSATNTIKSLFLKTYSEGLKTLSDDTAEHVTAVITNAYRIALTTVHDVLKLRLQVRDSERKLAARAAIIHSAMDL